MLRRSHKKSRRGCLEWPVSLLFQGVSGCRAGILNADIRVNSKRRHVKCDERRPVCSLCAVSQLSCRYTSNAVLAGSSTHVAFQQARGGFDCGTSPLNNFNVIQHFPISESPDIRNSSYPGLDEVVNLNHMELLVHMASDKELFTLGYHNGDRTTSVISGLRICLDAPYVLYQLSTFAARHLAYLRPEQADVYLYQATALQTRAISLFNASWNVISQTNCVAMVLFSSVLGSHILVDTLARRVEGGRVPFIEHFVQCINVEKGVYTIASMAWPLLMKSELETILSRSSQFTSRPPRGNHCRGIQKVLDGAKELDESEIQACREAANYLQVGFDAVFSKTKDEDEDKDEERQNDVQKSSNRFHMINSWLMLLKPAFRDLLSHRRPEAFVVLAYYALLLHHAKHMWQIGDPGAYILRIIDEYLAPEWKCWLKYPRDKITKSSHVSNDQVII